MPNHSSRSDDRRPEPARDPLPARVTTPLLTLITQQSMDEDYQHAAERRILNSGVEAPRRRSMPVVAAVVVVLFGVLVSVAFAQTSRNAEVEDAGRSTLVARIGAEREAVRDKQARIENLRVGNAALEEDLADLNNREQGLNSRLVPLRLRTGFGPAVGPGVRLVVEDAPDGGERIRKEDLFLLINALWDAGAEGVSLNGNRLSALTAISNSGPANNVELSPISPPYTLRAFGDPRTLRSKIVETSTYAEFAGLAARYGFRLTMQNEDRISMPSAKRKRLVATEPLALEPRREDLPS